MLSRIGQNEHSAGWNVDKGRVNVELESFTQCLSYLEAIGKPKDSLGMILPVVSSLLGIAVGFGLNFFRDWWKSRKETNNKKMCIHEDVVRLCRIADDVFVQSLHFIDEQEAGKKVLAHNLPRGINTPYIEKHFIEVAHLYSEQQRHDIVSLIPRLTGLNAILLELYEPAIIDSAVDSFRCFVSASATITYILEHCEQFLGGPIKPQSWVGIADRLEIKSAYIERMRAQGLCYPKF